MTLDDDIEDLVGGGAPADVSDRVKRHRDRLKREFEERVAQGRHGGGGATEDIGAVRNGVTSSWLAQALGMTHDKVKRKLVKCPSTRRGNTVIYTLREAMEYLVTPKVQMDELLKNLKKEDLPQRLQEGYWRALLLQDEYLEKAGHLWHSEDVTGIFGDVFLAIKSATQLWVDNMERETAVNPAQHAFLQREIDNLQKQIYDKLIEIPKKRITRPVAAKHRVEPTPETDYADDVESLV